MPIDFEDGKGTARHAAQGAQLQDTGEWQPVGAAASHRTAVNGAGASSASASSDSDATQRIDYSAVQAAMASGSAHAAGAGQVPPAGGASRMVPASDNAHYKVKKKVHKKHTGLKVAVAVIACLVVVVGAAGAALASSAMGLRDQASTAMQDVNSVQTALASSDYDAASSAAQDLSTTAHAMDEALQSTQWSLASRIPVIGSDVENVRTLASVLANVSDGAIVPLTAELFANPPSSITGDDGSIDFNAVSRILTAIEQGAPSMQEAADTLNAMPAMHIEQLQATVQSATQKLTSLNETYQQVSAAAPTINLLLGQEGDREYLVVAQNSAELRAAGGFPGSMGTLSVSGGKVSLGDFAAVYDTIDSIPTNLTDEELNLFYTYPDYSMNIGYNPDFPRVAQAWVDSYYHRNRQNLDGVISITPSVVQDLLAATGQTITLSDGTQLDGTNATKVLEYDIYWKYLAAGANYSNGNDIADGLFAEAAQQAFDAVLDNLNASTLSSVLAVLSENANDRHVMLWFADSDAESQIISQEVGGSLDSSTQTSPKLGVFLGPWKSHKLGWWLGCDTQVSDPVTAADGTRTYHITTTLSNSLTEEEMATGGDYIMGTGMLEAQGDMDPFTYLYVPAGGTIQNIASSNGAQYVEGTYKGLTVYYTPDVGSTSYPHPNNPLLAGETVTVTYDVVLPASVQGDLTVETMPTLTEYH